MTNVPQIFFFEINVPQIVLRLSFQGLIFGPVSRVGGAGTNTVTCPFSGKIWTNEVVVNNSPNENDIK